MTDSKNNRFIGLTLCVLIANFCLSSQSESEETSRQRNYSNSNYSDYFESTKNIESLFEAVCNNTPGKLFDSKPNLIKKLPDTMLKKLHFGSSFVGVTTGGKKQKIYGVVMTSQSIAPGFGTFFEKNKSEIIEKFHADKCVASKDEQVVCYIDATEIDFFYKNDKLNSIHWNCIQD